MMGLGILLIDLLGPLMEAASTFLPGEFFPYYFSAPYLQRPLLAAIMDTVVAGILGGYLLIQHLALMGDGLAHVAFGGVAVGIVLGATSPLSYALVFSVTAAVLIHEMQSREMLTGDASIAIFLTGMLALGLVILRLGGGALTTDIESYLFGNLNLIDEASLDLIALICLLSLIILGFIRQGLLACAVDPVSARVQGLPVRNIGLLFSVTTAAVVVVMVQVVGTLLVTALLVTPAATGQLLGRSSRQCMLWTQVFGFCSVIMGLYLSAEYDTGSGSMIALVAAILFAIVAITQVVVRSFIQSDENLN